MSVRRFYKHKTEEAYQNVKYTLPIPHIAEVNGEIKFKTDLNVSGKQIITVQKGYNKLDITPTFC